MASQTFQANLRLLGPLAVGILIASCARELRSDTEFAPLPDIFNAKITHFEIPVDRHVRSPEEQLLAPIYEAFLKPPEVAPVAKDPHQPAKATQVESPAKSAATTAKTGSVKTGAYKPASWPFGVGEILKIKLHYGMIEGGMATIEVRESLEMDGEKMLHLHGEVLSSRMVNLFYKVNNSFDSFVSLKNFLPFRQVIRQNESSRWGQSILTFDYKKNKAHFFQSMERHKKPKIQVDKEVDPIPFSQEIFSSLYFYRFLEAGKSGAFPVHDKQKSWNANFEFVGREKLSVPAGAFSALRYRVVPMLEGYLSSKTSVDVWLSDDDRRLMLKFNAKLKLGSLTGELASFLPGRGILLSPPELLTPFEVKP
jgi:hypothetical protein